MMAVYLFSLTISDYLLFYKTILTVLLLVPVLHVGVFHLAIMMTITSWHHGIAAGGCSCERKC